MPAVGLNESRVLRQALSLIIGFMSAVAGAQVVYVDQAAGAGGDGLSWGAAFKTIQAGVESAKTLGVPTVWVAEGTYQESVSLPSNLYSNIQIYGGLVAGAATLSGRDPVAHPSVIRPAAGARGVNLGFVTNVRLDGFDLRGANLSGIGNGAGLLVTRGIGIQVANCRFMGNQANNGGGAYLASSGGGSSVTFERCIFASNSANSIGGGIHTASNDGGSLTVRDCVFSGNLSSSGSAIGSGGTASATLANNIFSGNGALSNGAGVYLLGTGSISILNCTFGGNTANNSGGAIYLTNTATQIRNCIFYNNRTAAIYEASSSALPTVSHNVFFGSTGGDLRTVANGTLTGAAAINALTRAEFNVDGDPRFERHLGGTFTTSSQYDPSLVESTIEDAAGHYAPDELIGRTLRTIYLAGADSIEYYIVGNTSTTLRVMGTLEVARTGPGTVYEIKDYHTRAGGAGLDAGDNGAVGLPAQDAEGKTRVIGAAVDAGAFEFDPATMPAVTSIRRLDEAESHRNPVRFRVGFSESVMGVDAGDFAIEAPSISGASVVGVSGNGRFFTVSVDPGSSVGELRLDLIDDDSIVDESGNPLGGVGTGNGDFTDGDVYTMSSAPMLRLTLAGATLGDGTGTLNFETHTVGGTEPERLVVLRNEGSAPLSLGALALPAGYSAANALPSTLAAGTTTGLTLRMNTGTAGYYSGLLSLANGDAEANPYEVALKGAVRPAQLMGSAYDMLGYPADATIFGEDLGDNLGAASRASGDFNGDGYEDLAIAAAGADGPGNARANAGEVYLILGRPTLPASWDVRGTNGTAADMRVYGDEADNLTQASTLMLKDVNGDGLDDLIIGSSSADGPDDTKWDSGEVSIVFGRKSVPATLDLELNEQDVRIYGAVFEGWGERLTFQNSMAIGDLNGDGLNDLVMGTGTANRVHITFGRHEWPATILLGNGEGDVTLTGPTGSVPGRGGAMRMGDVNGDGRLDLVMVDPNAQTYRGQLFVVFGRENFPAAMNLAAGGADFSCMGIDASDHSTSDRFPLVVADVNGDGIDDIFYIAMGGDGPFNLRSSSGEGILILGKPTLGGAQTLPLAADCIVYGPPVGSSFPGLGYSGSLAAGDINGDGYSDLAFSSYHNGKVLVVQGRPAFPPVLDLNYTPADLEVRSTHYSLGLGYNLGISLHDLDGDGYDDLVLGEAFADGPAGTRDAAGHGYVFFGSPAMAGVVNASVSGGDIRIFGGNTLDLLGALGPFIAPDLNGDGWRDLLMTANGADGPGESRSAAGEGYILKGAGAATAPVVVKFDQSGDTRPREYGATRATVDYASGTNESTTLMTLLRGGVGVVFPAHPHASVAWQFETDREDFAAKLTMRYTDAELAGVTERYLYLYRSQTAAGPFVEVPTEIDLDRNIVGTTATESGVYILVGKVPPFEIFEGTQAYRDGDGPLDYGTIVEGVGTRARTFRVENLSGGTLSLDVPVMPEGFTMIEPLNASIAAGGNDSFTVALDNLDVGAHAGTMAIGSSSPIGSMSLELEGVVLHAYAAATITRDGGSVIGNGGAIDFGTVDQFNTSPTVALTLKNEGTIPLEVAGVSLPAPFVVIGTIPASLAPGETVNFGISMDTAGLGDFSGAFGIESNDEDDPLFGIGLSGEVIADVNPPYAHIIRLDPSPTYSERLVFRVVFNEKVGSSFEAADVTLSGTLSSPADVSIEQESPLTYRVTFNLLAPHADGSANLAIGGAVEDLSGNALGSVTPGAAYTVNHLQALKFLGYQFDNGFGYDVAAIDDVNGDGYADIAVGEYLHDLPLNLYQAGRVYLIDGRTPSIIRTIESPNKEHTGLFGSELEALGDMDGDGVGDLLVTAGGEGANDAGRVYVISTMTGAAIRTIDSTAPATGGSFGISLANMGDLTGDGIDDFAVGGSDESWSESGQVQVFNGATGALIRLLTSPNSQASGHFGGSIDAIDDISGDGKRELLVGAYYESPNVNQPNAGRAYLYQSSNWSLMRTIVSPNMHFYGYFGAEVARIPDIDGDGKGDYAIGATNYEGPNYTGRVYVFSGATGALRLTLDNDYEDTYLAFGSEIKGLDDVDGDGVPDIAVGVPGWDGGPQFAGEYGRVMIFSGATGALIKKLSPPGTQYIDMHYGMVLAQIPDVSGDGRPDLIVGAPGGSGGSGYQFSTATMYLVASGTGIAAAEADLFDGASPVASASGPIDLGSSHVATQLQRTYTLKNTGNAYMHASGLSVPAGYAVTEPLAATIAPGGQDTFTISVTGGVGTHAGNVLFQTNDIDEGNYSFSVTATVVAGAEADVSYSGTPAPSGGTALNLGTTVVGGAALSRTFTLSNPGTTALTITGLVASGGFTVVEGLPATIASGGSDNFTIELGAGTLGNFSGSVTIQSNDADEGTYAIALSGTVRENNAPVFGGLTSLTNTNTTLNLAWNGATDQSAVTYQIFRRTSGSYNFNSPYATTSNLNYTDVAVSLGVTYFYVVRARDAWGNSDTNTVEMSRRAVGPFSMVLASGVSGSTRYMGTPFAVTFIAADSGGRQLNDYPGTFTLRAMFGTQEAAVSPGVVGPFPNGSYPTNVTIWGYGTGCRLEMLLNGVVKGQSSNFNVFSSDARLTRSGTPVANGGSVAFGEAHVGDPAVAVTLNMANPGNLNLILSNVTLPTGFTLTEGLNSVITTGGGSDNFTISMSTATAGSKTGTVSITTNDPLDNPFTFTVSGNVRPRSELVWVDFAWGGTQVGSAAQPFSTFLGGADYVQSGGRMRIKPGNSAETGRIVKPMRLEADSGPVAIGRGGGAGEPQAGGASLTGVEKNSAEHWLFYR